MTIGAQWRAMQREAQLAAEQAAHGITLIGRANHAQTGLYIQAFFALSIGLERMGKLIVLADYANRHNGAFATDKDLRKIGHDLGPLLNKREDIAASLNQDRDHSLRPNNLIHQGIIDVISLFATKLRYYNLNHISGSAQGQHDPVALWWEKVAIPICDLHYTERQRKKDIEEATIMENLLGESLVVLHSTETGDSINSIERLFTQAKATKVVQKYGRLYTMQIIRWLASMLFELSHRGAYELRIQAILGLHEPFTIFFNDDSYLLGRKTWSIYPR